MARQRREGETRPPRSYTLAQLANAHPNDDADFMPFDPKELVEAAKRNVPGAILSLSAATHVSCAKERAIRVDSRIEKRLIKEQLLRGLTRVKMFGQKRGGMLRGAGPDIPPMFVKAVARVKQSEAAAKLAAAHAAAVTAAKSAAAAATGDASADEGDAPTDAPAGGDERRRRLLQLDADMSAFAAEEAAKRAAMRETDLDKVEDTTAAARVAATRLAAAATGPRACRRSRRATTYAPRPRG